MSLLVAQVFHIGKKRVISNSKRVLPQISILPNHQFPLEVGLPPSAVHILSINVHLMSEKKNSLTSENAQNII